MKRLKLIPIVAMTLGFVTFSAFQSCNKIAQKLLFDLNMQTQSVDVVIPVTSNTTGTITVGPVMSYYNVDSFIKAQTAQQLGVSNVKSVKLESCLLTINDADATNNFANFESCQASFFSNTNSTPYNMNIDNNPDTYSATLSLPVDNTVELSTYLGTEFTYTLTGKLRRVTTKELHCTIQVTYKLDVRG